MCGHGTQISLSLRFDYECHPHVSMLTFLSFFPPFFPLHSFSHSHHLALSHFPSVPLISCSHTISPLLYKNLDLVVYVFRTALLLIEEGITLINLPPSHSLLFFTCGDPARQRHEAMTWLTVNEDLVKPDTLHQRLSHSSAQVGPYLFIWGASHSILHPAILALSSNLAVYGYV